MSQKRRWGRGAVGAKDDIRMDAGEETCTHTLAHTDMKALGGTPEWLFQSGLLQVSTGGTNDMSQVEGTDHNALRTEGPGENVKNMGKSGWGRENRKCDRCLSEATAALPNVVSTHVITNHVR